MNTEQSVLENFVPENKRDIFFERLSQFGVLQEYQSGLKRLEYINNIFQERDSQNLPCSTNGPTYLLNLREIKSSFLAGVAIMATARKSSLHRLEQAQRLLRKFVSEDLSQPKYNMIVKENFPEKVTGFSSFTGRKHTNCYLTGHFFVFLDWTGGLEVRGKTIIPKEPSFFTAKHLLFFGVSGVGYTDIEALDNAKKSLANKEKYQAELARKEWEEKELLNLKNSKRIWQIRRIAEKRKIPKFKTATAKTLINEILYRQQDRQLAFF